VVTVTGMTCGHMRSVASPDHHETQLNASRGATQRLTGGEEDGAGAEVAQHVGACGGVQVEHHDGPVSAGGPQGEPVNEAVYFHRKLVEAKLPVGGVIVNKVHYEADEEAEGEAEADLHDLFEDKLAERVAQNFADYQALAQRDAENVEHLQRELTPKAVIRIPYLDEDVHDLVALLKIDRYLFASEEQREELAASGAA